MTETNKQLGKLESVHGISPVFLQRALVLIILSFVFFLAMLIAFSIRQQIGYFILATAFLIVKLFTLFGWMQQRKKTVLLYEKGLMLGKQVCLYDDIEKISLNQTGKILGGAKNEGEIIKTNGEKIVLPQDIDNLPGVIRKIEGKLEKN